LLQFLHLCLVQFVLVWSLILNCFSVLFVIMIRIPRLLSQLCVGCWCNTKNWIKLYLQVPTNLFRSASLPIDFHCRIDR
jgi:hypothetical protein